MDCGDLVVFIEDVMDFHSTTLKLVEGMKCFMEDIERGRWVLESINPT